MITIQSVMLVTLGVLLAALACLILGPAYRRRVARLTAAAIKRALPMTEAEIRADKDRLRAEYAVLVHRLETKLEQASLAAARQHVEINRRDAAISALEGDIARLSTAIDEHENARRVLEQTVMDRLPKLEQRLAEARKLLVQRDREVGELGEKAAQQARALEEATALGSQQREELHRLRGIVAARAGRGRGLLSGAKGGGEVALRAEIEALNARIREQADTLERLQGSDVHGGHSAEATGLSDAGGARDARGIARLQQELAATEEALHEARVSAETNADTVAALEAELARLRTASQDQAAELASLRAALEAYRAGEQDDRAKESKVALRAQASALQAQTDEQAALIQSLRAELAAANERLARQAAHFRNELRVLGSSAPPLPASGHAAASAEPRRRALSDRIKDPQVARLAKPERSETSDAAVVEGERDNAAGEARAERRPRLVERLTGFDKPSA